VHLWQRRWRCRDRLVCVGLVSRLRQVRRGTTGTTGTTERRNDGTTGTEETQMDAETARMNADTSETQTSGDSDWAGPQVANPALQGTHFEITPLRTPLAGVPERLFQKQRIPLEGGRSWNFPKLSASIRAVSASICVSSVPGVMQFWCYAVLVLCSSGVAVPASLSHAYRTHFTSSAKLGFFPYMSIPTR
jgi:hypothetical protein